MGTSSGPSTLKGIVRHLEATGELGFGPPFTRGSDAADLPRLGLSPRRGRLSPTGKGKPDKEAEGWDCGERSLPLQLQLWRTSNLQIHGRGSSPRSHGPFPAIHQAGDVPPHFFHPCLCVTIARGCGLSLFTLIVGMYTEDTTYPFAMSSACFSGMKRSRRPTLPDGNPLCLPRLRPPVPPSLPSVAANWTRPHSVCPSVTGSVHGAASSRLIVVQPV